MRRSSNRRQNKGKDEKPKWLIPALCTLGICIAGILLYKILTPPPSLPPIRPLVAIEPTKANSPKAAIIYLDDSKSMEGYVKCLEFGYHMSDLFSVYPNTTAQAVNDTIQIANGHEWITKLKSGTLTQKGESMLNEDLKKIVNKIKNSDGIAFFVTDAIMSGTNAQINSTKERDYNIAHKQDLMHDISKVFKGQGVAVSVYRLMSDFNGKYYCYNNDNASIHKLRPYFVIAIGKPDVVADFKQRLATMQEDNKFKFKPSEEIHFIESKPINHAYGVNGGGQSLSPDATNNIITFNKQKIDNQAQAGNGIFTITIPLELFCNYDKETIEELSKHIEITVSNQKYTPKEIQQDKARIQFKVERSYLSTNSSYDSLRVAIPYFTPEWINKKSIEGNQNENDLFIIKAPLEGGTFLLSYFIQGINNGVKPEEQTKQFIYDRTIYFKEQN